MHANRLYHNILACICSAMCDIKATRRISYLSTEQKKVAVACVDGFVSVHNDVFYSGDGSYGPFGGSPGGKTQRQTPWPLPPT